MVKILANDGIDLSAKQQLEQAGFQVETQKVDQQDLINQINQEEYQVLLVRSATKVDASLLEACKTLKLIGRAGVGLDNIDLVKAKELGVKVFNTPSSSSIAVAELIVGAMFALSRKLDAAAQKMPKEGHEHFKSLKKSFKGSELRGKTLGIIGFGRIGKALASYAYALGMKVVAHDAFLNDTVELELKIADQKMKLSQHLSSFDEVLQKSDYLSLHIPKAKDRSPIIGESEFKQMPSNAYLLNAARGGVVDEMALLDALDRDEIAGAFLDVFEQEPTPNSALLKHSKILSTPHIGASTIEAQQRIGIEICEHIFEYFS